MGLVNGEPLPLQYWRWMLAERFGWRLDYIDALSLGDMQEWLEIEDARLKAQETHGRKNRKSIR